MTLRLSTQVDFKKPVIAYTAATNIDAHLIVDMLHAHGVKAHAIEDQSGIGIWAFGTISQLHQPNVWVDEPTLPQAVDLIQEFEEKIKNRNTPVEAIGEITVICEDCGQTTLFPASLDGTTQECRHCHAYVDVGELPWEDDFGTAVD